MGFNIIDLSKAASSENKPYIPAVDKAPELMGYLSANYGLPIEKARGFRSGLILPSGTIIHVSGSKEHPETGGFYALTYNKYEDILNRKDSFYAIILGGPDMTFVLPSDKVRTIFYDVDPGEDKEWHYRITKDDEHYVLRPSRDIRTVGEIHHVEGYLNKWDQISEKHTTKDRNAVMDMVIHRAKYDLSNLGSDSLLDRYLSEVNEIMEKFIEFVYEISNVRKLGVSTILDVVRYMISGIVVRNEQNHWRLFGEAMIDYVLPQFDRLDIDTLSQVKNKSTTIFRIYGSRESIPEVRPFLSEIEKMLNRLEELSKFFGNR